MRDSTVPGEVERILHEVEKIEDPLFTNTHLAAYANDLAERIIRQEIEKFVADYFAAYEWVGSGRSGKDGAEWRIVLDIPALRERLLKFVVGGERNGRATTKTSTL